MGKQPRAWYCQSVNCVSGKNKTMILKAINRQFGTEKL